MGKPTGNGFGKVTNLFDAMLETLKEEQDNDDDHEKEHYDQQIDTSDNEKNALERSISGVEGVIADIRSRLQILHRRVQLRRLRPGSVQLPSARMIMPSTRLSWHLALPPRRCSHSPRTA